MKVFFKRTMFFAITTATYVVVFPLVGGIPFTFTLIAIPGLYLYLFVPALLTGVTVSALMLIFKRVYKLGTIHTAFRCSVVGSIYMGFYLALFRFYGVFAAFFSPKHHAINSGEAIMQGAIQAMIIVSITFLFLAGGVTSLLIQGPKMESLLDDSP
jgi:hypothetical protein